jgi:hypothetical protein
VFSALMELLVRVLFNGESNTLVLFNRASALFVELSMLCSFGET